MHLTTPIYTQIDWALPYARRVRALRLVVLGVGFPLSLLIAHPHLKHLHETTFLLGVVLFVVATGLT